MNIFIVCVRLCYGGAERVAVSLANGFVQKGHAVTLVTNTFEPVSYDVDSRINVLPLVATNNNKLLKWGSSFRLLRGHLKNSRPDIIIGISSTCSLVARIAGIGMNIPVIMTEHDSFERPASAPLTFWNWFGKFQLNKIYEYITVLTDADKYIIGQKLRHVTVMPNPLAISPVEVVPPKEKIILAAGRLADWHYKGFDILIKAWSKLAARYPDWHLHIAGKDEHQGLQLLQDLCRQYCVEQQVKFLGFRQDIQRLYRDAEIFVLSSRYEGFGLVLIEAMSQGCACVAADYKGRQTEIIRNADEGLVCEPESVESMTMALDRVLSDTDYRQNIQRNAVKRSTYYSIDNTVARWEQYLNTIIS